MWRSDGTAAGTYPLPASISYGPTPVAAGNRLFFPASDPVHGEELWSTDGTVNGTALVTDIFPGRDPNGFINNGRPSVLRNVGGQIFFTGYTETTGDELITSDGTAAGTRVVADIYPGGIGSRPSEITAVGRQLYFFAAFEPWTSDGTAAGTTLLGDINHCPLVGNCYESSSPYGLMRAGRRLFFTATDGLLGHELWAIDLDAPLHGLLRSDRVRSLAPVSPPLDGVLPLDPARDLYRPDHASGDIDPESGVLGDAARPIVFYALDAPVTLSLVKTALGDVRISF